MKDYLSEKEPSIQDIIRLCQCRTHNPTNHIWGYESNSNTECSLFKDIKKCPVQDCTEKCHSTQHGDHISATITSREVSDVDLFSYIKYACERCETVRDSVGRTALHVAASCGKTELCRLLIEYGSDINKKDNESGCTALHRSVFCGKIDTVVELMKLGANQDLRDYDGLTFLDHAILDRFNQETSSVSGELFTWGANSNNSLGSQARRDVPDPMNVFHKEHTKEKVKDFLINEFHSVILTESGSAFSCGHGHGGRLGLNTQHTELVPKRIKFESSSNVPNAEPVQIKACSLARDHSLFLATNGTLYSCGLNRHRVLGFKPPMEAVLTPKALRFSNAHLVSVATGDYHSVAWTEKGLFTWGLNAGQLGHPFTNVASDKYILTPKKVLSVDFETKPLKLVKASTGATVFVTANGDVYALYQRVCRKLASRVINLIDICVIGGSLDHTLDADLSNKDRELRVAALTQSGSVLVWQSSDAVLRDCNFSVKRSLMVTKMSLNVDHLLLVTRSGEAFKGSFRPKRKKIVIVSDGNQKKSEFHKLVERDDVIGVKLEKIPRIHRALSICSDPKGRNFGIIQDSPYKYLDYHLYSKQSILNDSFLELLNTADRDDGLVDVILKTGHREFLAHNYILSSRSPYLAKLLSQNQNKSIVDLKDIDEDMLEQILQFIYTRSCDVISGVCNKGKLRWLYSKWFSDKQQERSKGKTTPNALKIFKATVEKFELGDLKELLNDTGMKLVLEDDEALLVWTKRLEDVRLPDVTFDRVSFPELYDVEIVCNENKSLRAHKCVLAARSEYFSNMFSVRWASFGTVKDSKISLPFSIDVVECLLEFLYTDSIEKLNDRDAELVSELLKLSDLILTMRLREYCENVLSDMITIKNTTALLNLASLLHADLLQQNCLRFIHQNLSVFLETRLLDDLNTQLLQKLSQFYQDAQDLERRQLPQYSNAASLNDIVRVSSEQPSSAKKEAKRTITKSKRTSMSTDTVVAGSPKADLSSSLELSSTFLTPDCSPRVSGSHFLSDPFLETRIKAISSINSLGKRYQEEDNFTALRKSDGGSLSGSFVDEIQFPLLSSSPKSSGFINSSRALSYKPETRHKAQKLSQKQRKRLSSESGAVGQATSPNLAESPKNPWKMLPEPVQQERQEGVVNMESIIYSERKLKENLVRMKNKPLALTQLEDKAMDELKRFYNVDSVEDELITIERVSLGAVALPVWVPK